MNPSNPVSSRLGSHWKWKYPFISDGRMDIEKREVDPMESFSENYKLIKDSVTEVIRDAIEGKERTSGLEAMDSTNLTVYPWIRLTLQLLALPRVTYKVANLLSKHYDALLRREDGRTLLILSQDIGLDVRRDERAETHGRGTATLEFTVNFANYVRIAKSFKAPSWKLVNRPMNKGYVFLMKADLVRVLQETIKENFVSLARKQMDKSTKARLLEDFLIGGFIDELKIIIEEGMKTSIAGSWEEQEMPVDKEAYPPCLVAVLDKNKKGMNLAHSERLFMTYFLLTIGADVEEVLDVFKQQPDYNEKIARYQVEYAAGLHGKKTKYKPHNCATLESLGVCMKREQGLSHDWCNNPEKPMTNPLVFYRRKIWIKEKRAQEQGEEGKQEEEEKRVDSGTVNGSNGGGEPR